ncbi:hypothetical protein WJ968_34250 [Achromobacter xylosoxidans]
MAAASAGGLIAISSANGLYLDGQMIARSGGAGAGRAWRWGWTRRNTRAARSRTGSRRRATSCCRTRRRRACLPRWTIPPRPPTSWPMATPRWAPTSWSKAASARWTCCPMACSASPATSR